MAVKEAVVKEAAIREAAQPRYRQVYAALRHQLEEQHLRPEARIPPDRELVARFQVSRLTIAKAVSRLVAEGYLERRPGSGTYVTDWARRRADATSLHVALLVPYAHDDFVTSLIKAVSGALYQHDVTLQFFDSNGEPEKEAQYLRRLLEQPAEGLIAFPISLQHNRDLYCAYQETGRPLVFLDRYYPDFDADRVVSDNVQGAYLATRLLLAQGHRVIAHLMPEEARNPVLIDRRLGYTRALLEAGLPVDSALICEIHDTHPQRADEPKLRCAQALKEWRQRPDPPTAVFCANDWILQSCLLALRRDDLRVPQDMAVTGFCDGDTWLHAIDDPFEGVRQQTALLGRRAVDLLLSRLQTPPAQASVDTGDEYQHTAIVPHLWRYEGHIP